MKKIIINKGIARFKCPGCNIKHHVPVDKSIHGKRAWTFSGGHESPTFSPSVLVRGTMPISDEGHKKIMNGEDIEIKKFVCHSFVENGKIRFLNDCTHIFAGKILDLPDFD